MLSAADGARNRAPGIRQLDRASLPEIPRRFRSLTSVFVENGAAAAIVPFLLVRPRKPSAHGRAFFYSVARSAAAMGCDRKKHKVRKRCARAPIRVGKSLLHTFGRGGWRVVGGRGEWRLGEGPKTGRRLRSVDRCGNYFIKRIRDLGTSSPSEACLVVWLVCRRLDRTCGQCWSVTNRPV